MGGLNWDKNNRAKVWRQSVRDTWSGHVPAAPSPASEKQVIYLQALLVKHGRRPLTVDEMAQLTIASASRLIKEFTGK